MVIQAYELPFRRRLEVSWGEGGDAANGQLGCHTLITSLLSPHTNRAGAATTSTVNHRFISSCSFNFSFFLLSLRFALFRTCHRCPCMMSGVCVMYAGCPHRHDTTCPPPVRMRCVCVCVRARTQLITVACARACASAGVLANFYNLKYMITSCKYHRTNDVMTHITIV